MFAIEFFPLDITHQVEDGKARILLFGKTKDGKRVCIADDSFDYFFWVIVPEKETIHALAKKIEALKITEQNRLYYITKLEIQQRIYLGQTVDAIKVFVNDPRSVQQFREAIHHLRDDLGVKEVDISYEKKYLIEKRITSLLLTSVEGELISMPDLRVDLVLKPRDFLPQSETVLSQPRVLAFDIEVYNKDRYPDDTVDPIVMIGFAGYDGFKKVITWKKVSGAKKFVEVVKSEEALIERCVEVINDYKPDYIVGYFSDGFDFPYLVSRAKKLGLPFTLGLDGSNVKIKRRAENLTARVTGVVHIDIFKFIRRVMRNTLDVDEYDLDTVAQALLGKGKTDADVEHLWDAWDNHPERLKNYVEYNLNDAQITLELFFRMLPSLEEMIKLIGHSPFDVSRMTFGQLVEAYLLKETQHHRQISPNRPGYSTIAKRRLQSLKGATVYEPQPGLHNDLAVFDFRSLYPSVITAHNLDPGTLVTDSQDAQAAPEISLGKKKIVHYFTTKKDGFIPLVLKEVIMRRNRIKDLVKKEKGAPDPVLYARQDALKILSASFYGYLGFAGARWYSFEAASATTAYGRYYIQMIAEKAKKNGFHVIYGDTDSLFVTLGKKTKKDAATFLRDVNMELPSLMELELQGYYPRGLFVMKKGGTQGAKKKYALIDERGKIRVVGFETVRGDWSVLAKEVQSKVIDIVLHDVDAKKAVKYVKDLVKKVVQKKIPLEKMVMQKRLLKDVADYEAVGPHVVVAKQMQAKGHYVSAGTMIRFVIEEGKGSIGDRAKHIDDAKSYDAEYYLNHQIIPAVMPIFEVLGFKKDFLSGTNQAGLGDF